MHDPLGAFTWRDADKSSIFAIPRYAIPAPILTEKIGVSRFGTLCRTVDA